MDIPDALTEAALFGPAGATACCRTGSKSSTVLQVARRSDNPTAAAVSEAALGFGTIRDAVPPDLPASGEHPRLHFQIRLMSLCARKGEPMQRSWSHLYGTSCVGIGSPTPRYTIGWLP